MCYLEISHLFLEKEIVKDEKIVGGILFDIGILDLEAIKGMLQNMRVRFFFFSHKWVKKHRLRYYRCTDKVQQTCFKYK